MGSYTTFLSSSARTTATMTQIAKFSLLTIGSSGRMSSASSAYASPLSNAAAKPMYGTMLVAPVKIPIAIVHRRGTPMTVSNNATVRPSKHDSRKRPRTPFERFHVCSIVLDQPVGSGRCVVGAARPRGDELRVLFWRQGEQLANTIHQGVQVAVHQLVNPIASRQRPIQPHHG